MLIFGFIVTNTNPQLLEILEPLCSVIYTDGDYVTYQQQESTKTSFDLNDRVRILESGKINDILVNIDGTTFTQQDFQIINQLSEILQDSGEIGQFELGNLHITINSLEEYQNDLIKV